ncbi:hypothetical protein BDV27DRAFT_97800 [Aspergillus caelatus]|uniref:Uncharacterized protein n=1 Tax=Aspergillus caelatus TaxID=61420 RepID=A0A5N7AJP4_9EURO|nr:uncharacterized protein BDV27DRAFT_97800 [Aspergillus caelatus]KAE8370097.1 hypothetical protein BDV27DRAFT_97800 [Aspergillus caelatus]
MKMPPALMSLIPFVPFWASALLFSILFYSLSLSSRLSTQELVNWIYLFDSLLFRNPITITWRNAFRVENINNSKHLPARSSQSRVPLIRYYVYRS